MNSEWTRWQEADKWSWDEAKRRRWAEGLWRHQRRRAIARDSTRRAIRAAEQRQRLEVRSPAFPSALKSGVVSQSENGHDMVACLELGWLQMW